LQAEEEKRHVGSLRRLAAVASSSISFLQEREVEFGARLARERTRFTITERGYSTQFDHTVDCGVSGGTTSPITSAVTWRVRWSEEWTKGNLVTRVESRTMRVFFFFFFFFFGSFVGGDLDK
jgi:hypothetical protein